MIEDDYKIEKATAADVNEIVELYSEFRNGWQPASPLGDKLVKYPSLKVLHNEAIVGFAYCFYFAPDVIELANIYMSEKFRSNNIGTDLISRLEKKLLDNGYTGVIATNSDAYTGKPDKRNPINFYLRNGYGVTIETSKTRIFYKELRHEA